jgi:SAM-dependent methyltransferase
MPAEARLFLPAGYRARLEPSYFEDAGRLGIVHQPDVYPYAAVLADRMAASWLIDIGCGRARKLLPFRDRFRLFGVDYGENIRWCREEHPEHRWLERDLTSPGVLPIPEHIASDAVVICSDVIEHLPDPLPLVRNLANLAERCRAVVVSTPDRVLVHGRDHRGPPDNPAHVREWSLSELLDLFAANGATPALAGHTRNNDVASLKRTILLTFGPELKPPSDPAPAEFTVLAVVCTHNDVDIIGSVIDHLLAQNMLVHLIDTWSTDGTFERARSLVAGGDRVRIERLPPDAPAENLEWGTLLHRVEQVAAGANADWVVFQDANEICRPPWPKVSLRDGIWAVDRAGYDAVLHTVVQLSGIDLTAYLRPGRRQLSSSFEFGHAPTHRSHTKAWKRGPRTSITAEDRPDDSFDDARLYPLNFTSLRFVPRADSKSSGMLRYDEATFEREFVTELVAGINVHPSGDTSRPPRALAKLRQLVGLPSPAQREQQPDA